MTKPVITVTLETQAYAAIRLLIDNQIKRLPVIDSAGKVVGMVNRRTLLNGLLGEQVEDGKS